MSARNKTGEWAKQGRDLWTHPKVRRMAAILGGQWQLELPLSGADKTGQVRTTVLIHTVVGGLSWLFLTINRHASEAGAGSMDAILSDMTADNYFDDVTGLPGLQAAMIAVGWAVHDKEKHTITLPNYLEHNDLAKGEKRAGRKGDSESPDALRKKKERAEKKAAAAKALADKVAGQLTDNSPLSDPDKTRTSADNPPQKRSEETELLKTHVEKKLKGADNPEGADSPLEHRTEFQIAIDALRPDSWGKLTHWSAADLEACERAVPALRAMPPDGWKLLAWFFRWIADPWNAEHRAEECRVTGSRERFLDAIGDYHARASRLWIAEKRPRLEPKQVVESKITPLAATTHLEPLMTPEEFRAAAQIDNGLARRVPDSE